MLRPILKKYSIAVIAASLQIAPTVPQAFSLENKIVAANSNAQSITKFPEKPNKRCRNGKAKIYDECTNQIELLIQAAKRAAKEGKVLLISFGAEWCIWCHVFDQYVQGNKSKFTYEYGAPDEPDLREPITLYEKEKHDVSAEAEALKSFVAASFVILNIDSQFAPAGSDVVIELGAAEHFENSIPYIFSVSKHGKYAAHFISDRAEIRRDGLFDEYRGYDRKKLLAELKRLHAAALN